MWHIIFYEKENGSKPLEEYLDLLHTKQRAKVLRSILLLKEFGPLIGLPHVRYLQNDLYELRIQQSSNIFRIFFFTWYNHQLILLHGFTKKNSKNSYTGIRFGRNL